MEANRIIVGDVLAALRALPADTVQTVVTSPPYWGLRNYGVDGQIGLEPTPAAFVEKMVEVFREVRRVLRPDGTAWVNLGDSYCGSWGNYSGHNRGAGHQRDIVNGSTIPNPAYEGAENWRPPTTNAPGLKSKDLVGVPWRVALALQADGWWLRSDIIWHKPNPMPESTRDRPTKAHEYVFLLAKSERYYYNADAIRTPFSEETKALSFETMNFGLRDQYATPPAPKRPAGWASHNGHHGAFHRDGRERPSRRTPRGGEDSRREKPAPPPVAGANARTVWTIATQAFPGAHFATFPEELPRRCIAAGTRPGDIVLDPFMGSGTVGMVAKRLARRWIGIELNPEYARMAEERIAAEPEALLGE